jgi:aconitase A
LESVLRNCDNQTVTEKDYTTIVDWATTSKTGGEEIQFNPSRVILQDFTVSFYCLRKKFLELESSN